MRLNSIKQVMIWFCLCFVQVKKCVLYSLTLQCHKSFSFVAITWSDQQAPQPAHNHYYSITTIVAWSGWCVNYWVDPFAYIALADSIDTKLTLQYYTVTLKLIKVAQSGWTQKAKLPLTERSHQIVEADPVTIQKQTLFKNMTKSQKYFMHDSSGFNLSRYDITLWPRDKVTVTKTCIKCALSGDYNCVKLARSWPDPSQLLRNSLAEMYELDFRRVNLTNSVKNIPPHHGQHTLQAWLSSTFLQTLLELVMPLKGHSLSPQSCPLTLSTFWKVWVLTRLSEQHSS